MSHLLSRVQLLGAFPVAAGFTWGAGMVAAALPNPNVCMLLSTPSVWSTTQPTRWHLARASPKVGPTYDQ